MTKPAEPDKQQRQAQAYNRMLERVKDFIHNAEDQAGPRINHALEAAKERAAELGELTREEAETVGEYLRRDLHDAADYMSETGRDLRDWFSFDLMYAEQTLLDWFFRAVDQTRVDLGQVEWLEPPGERHAGEITGVGTLRCIDCGRLMHFHETRPIPPCPKCKGTIFQREAGAGD